MRRMLSRLFLAAMACVSLTQCRTPLSTAASSERAPVLLAIFAHPDDEASVSAVLAKYAAAGVQVHLAIATDGRLGVSAHAGIPAGDELAAVRDKELQCAADTLGLQAPIRFGLHDQMRMAEGLQPYMTQMLELRERVQKLFEDLQPDAVITWGPSGWTGHPDHRVVSAVVTEVFQSKQWARPLQLYYPALPTAKVPASTPFPVATVDERFLGSRISLDPSDYDKAKQAWQCHQSQYTPEQIEQMHRALVSGQAGMAYFQTSLPMTGTSQSLLPTARN
jgi:LmbE family N-acetylglucosaminyl deacetylase